MRTKSNTILQVEGAPVLCYVHYRTLTEKIKIEFKLLLDAHRAGVKNGEGAILFRRSLAIAFAVADYAQTYISTYVPVFLSSFVLAGMRLYRNRRHLEQAISVIKYDILTAK